MADPRPAKAAPAEKFEGVSGEDATLLALAKASPTKELDSTASLANQDVADREQNRNLRGTVAGKLIAILSCELIFLGLLIVFQGFGLWGFKLHEVVFSIFTTSALAQTFLLVRVVVKDLFPSGGKIITK